MILVTYATTQDSTKEVAEAIGATLRDQGFKVDLHAAREVETITEYADITALMRRAAAFKP